ncbi:MAG TPA: DUF1684 domain-containing protein [Flavipsychrobacter sp.]|nr:DUF1684 domain-containing protein [Flavipsychrobacter sp.]
MKFWLSTLFCLAAFSGWAQSYADSIATYREHYKQEFLTDSHSPLKAEDTGFLRFYPPNSKYRVAAHFKKAIDTTAFEMHTHSGKIKMYRKYGVISFNIGKTSCSLEVYQSLDLMKKEELKDYLFVPFNDLTNYETTYAGGRYLDFSIKDIVENKLMLDFNKCYNPYCAFASGYSCPIPPQANKLKVRIPAGEKLFGREVKE